MNLLNVGCGGHRPGPPWINLDTLKESLRPGTPERTNLDAETNYVECHLLNQRIPFADGFFDGILLQHVLEHFECHEAVGVLGACRRVLRTGGILCASVPDAGYFLGVYEKDNRDNAEFLFGESISGDWHDQQCEKFFDYALFHREHKQILNIEGLACLLLRAGFARESITPFELAPHDISGALLEQLNRKKFSAILYAYK